MLRYPVASATRTNLDLGWGTVRFTYVPGFNGATPRMDLPLFWLNWQTANTWKGLELSYRDKGAPDIYGLYNFGNTSVQFNGIPQFWDFGSYKLYGGIGIESTVPTVLPPSTDWSSTGFAMGTDNTGNFSQADGTFDSVETFNYPLGAVDGLRRQQFTAHVTPARQLQFSRSLDDTSAGVGGATFLPWPLTLSRRTLGTTAWTQLFSNSTAETYIDTAAVVGTAYEYQASFSFFDGPQLRQMVAGIEMPPRHYLGNVILLVDDTLVSGLITELNQLKTALVGDGWSVKQVSAPRHDDLTWANNPPNRTNVEGQITANYVANVPNVIFILGHVTIPYSGTRAHDGHELNNGNHIGSWVCDAYYGYLSKTGWTDTLNVSTTSELAVAGDGKFDQSYLVNIPSANPVGRLPDLAVARVDFDRMPAFAPLTELDLIKRYLAKDFKYRANGVPTFGRVSAFGEDYAVASLSFAGAAFGIEPGRLFNGNNLRDRVPADLGVHYRYGNDDQVSDGLGGVFYATSFANAAEEVPVTFRNVWFSYASDWARLTPVNNRFQIDDNFLRASLGWPNYGLATVGGKACEFSSLGAGLPLAETMTRGWQTLANVPAFESILGDPTLRLFRVTPPQSVRLVVRNGSSVTLTWDPAIEAGLAYYVYKSVNGLDGFAQTPNPLNAVRLQGNSYTDSNAVGANLTYQVRATKLQSTGSGSFWNLSQGTFVTVP